MLDLLLIATAPPDYTRTDPAQTIAHAIWEGATIRYSDDPCHLSETAYGLRTGCYDYSTDTIELLPGMDDDWSLYVVLHELGHRWQHSAGVPFDECEADYWAMEHGAAFSGYGCDLQLETL